MTGEGETGPADPPSWSFEDFSALEEGLASPTLLSVSDRLRRALRAAIGQVGLELNRRRPPPEPQDLRGVLDHPVDALLNVPEGAFIIGVPVARLRLPFHFVPVREGGYPMVEMAHRIAGGDTGQAAIEPLETFYSRWRPRTRADLYGVPNAEASAALRALPAWVPISPWTTRDPLVVAAEAAIVNRSESAEHGQALGVRHGHLSGGPWSAEKIAVEYRRTTTLVHSIRREGFRYKSVIKGFLLLDGRGNWAMSVIEGQHRTNVADALGLTHLPVLVPPQLPPVRREEAEHWPGVRKGTFTRAQALLVFDRMMAGEPPPGCPHPGSPDRLGWQAGRGNGSAQGS